jgi:hypothetical protein
VNEQNEPTTTRPDLVKIGGIAEWPARFVFKVMEEIEHFQKDHPQA